MSAFTVRCRNKSNCNNVQILIMVTIARLTLWNEDDGDNIMEMIIIDDDNQDNNKPVMNNYDNENMDDVTNDISI